MDDNGKPVCKSLGPDTGLDYRAALEAAETWWCSLEAGASKRARTVEAAVRRYADQRAIVRDPDAGRRDHRQFRQVLYGTAFGRVPLDQLTAEHIEDWRNSLVTGRRSKVTANRIYRSFRAAMNYAHRRMLVAGRPWDAVDPFPVAEGSRQTYLTIAERRELLAACGDELRRFLTALLFTGARPGEMERARVRDLDLATRTLRLSSHKGRGGAERVRHFRLAGPALTFFGELATGKGRDELLVGPRGWGRKRWSRGLRAAVKTVNARRRAASPAAEPFPVGVVCYDMRHIAISDWLQAGNDIGSVAKAAGTSVVMIDRHYYKFIAAAQDRLAAVPVL